MLDVNLQEEVPVEEKEKFFESTRTKLAGAFVALLGVLAWFSGVFPDLQVPVVDLEVAKVFVNGASIVITAWLVGRSIRNTPVGGNAIVGLVSDLLAMFVEANKKPFPQEEEK